MGAHSLVVRSIVVTPHYVLYYRVTENSHYTIGVSSSRLQQQTVTFRDGDSQWKVGMKEAHDVTRDATVHSDVELGDFFSRPILLKTYTWTPGTSWTTTSFKPWSLFLSNPRVANRMSNYANFSGKMCIKVLVNGNSFYYGRLMMYYVPLSRNDYSPLISAGTACKIMNSQRMKMFIDPCASQGGEMCLPFLWFYDMANLSSSTDVDLGDLNIIALNELKHANAGSTPLNISIYGWLQDVKLTMPTASNMALISTQAGPMDEYGSSTLSNVASAVARTAGRLGSMPVIGPYARATEIAAGAGASVAKFFGMSRPGLIDAPSMMQPRYVSGMAVTDIGDASAKLTVDSKQELCIDNSVTGVSDGDEMVLSKVAGVETYISTFNWTTSAAQNTILFAARPTPQHFYSGGTPTYYTIPACCFVANAFTYWRGTMRYRFQIVCSGYHKGRLLFVWDPISGKSVPEQNVQYSKIVDITQEKDFVLDIPWGQPRTWLKTEDLTNAYFSANALTYTTANSSSTNGVLTVYVLNELVTPNSAINNDIQVNVFVSMCDDAEFAVPHNRFATYSAWTGIGTTPQSGGELESAPEDNAPVINENTEEYVPCIPTDNAMTKVYIGESVPSFRNLIKRYNHMWTAAMPSGNTGHWVWQLHDFPLPRAYAADGIRSGATYSYNPVNTTLMRYLAFGYLVYRGGVRHKFLPWTQGNCAVNGFLVAKRNLTHVVANPTLTTQVTTSSAAMEDQIQGLFAGGAEGLHITPMSQQPVLEVELPFYRNARFALTRGGYAASATDVPYVEDLTHTIAYLGQFNAHMYYSVYVAGAEDSNFSCFQGCVPFQIAPTFS